MKKKFLPRVSCTEAKPLHGLRWDPTAESSHGQDELAGCLLQAEVLLELQRFFCFCFFNTGRDYLGIHVSHPQAWRSAAKGSWWLQHEQRCKKLYLFLPISTAHG